MNIYEADLSFVDLPNPLTLHTCQTRVAKSWKIWKDQIISFQKNSIKKAKWQPCVKASLVIDNHQRPSTFCRRQRRFKIPSISFFEKILNSSRYSFYHLRGKRKLLEFELNIGIEKYKFFAISRKNSTCSATCKFLEFCSNAITLTWLDPIKVNIEKN